MSLRPLGDKIILKVLEGEETTASGIVLPDSAKEKSQEAEVIAVGPGKENEEGGREAMEVKPGDRILFSKYSGTEIKYEGKEYLVVSQRDVLAVFE